MVSAVDADQALRVLAKHKLSDPTLFDVLTATYAELGKLDDARTLNQRAIESNAYSTTETKCQRFARGVLLGEPLALDKLRTLLIAYSTGLGEAAADGDKGDGHSPFARILAENIPIPDVEIGDMFKRVSRQMVATAQQKPSLDFGWGVGEDFAFVGKP